MRRPAMRPLPRPAALLPLLLATLAAGAALAPAPARADQGLSLRELHSARSYGLAGTGRAMGLGMDASGGNPAAAALLPMYRMELTGAWDWHNKDAIASVGITDGASGPVAASVAYHLAKLGRGDAQQVAHVTNLGFAVPLAQSFLLGASVRYAVLRGPEDFNKLTADAGFLIRPTPVLAFGAAAHNIIDTRMALLPRSYTLHAALGGQSLGVGVDARSTRAGGETTWELGGGAEYALGQGFPVRAGYRWDTGARAGTLGVGLGFVTGGGGLDLGYQHDFSARGARVVAVTFRMLVQAR